MGYVAAEKVQAPLQMKVNTEIVRKVFNNRDELIFNLMQSTQLIAPGDFTEEVASFQSLIATIKPIDGIENHEFDFDLHMSKEYLGAESDKV